MATVTYLSWNLEKYGEGKFIKNSIGAANYSALLRAVADTAKGVGANIIALLELCKGTAMDIGLNILDQLVLLDGGDTPQWRGTTVETKKQDTYVLLWKNGYGFEGVDDGTGKDYVKGLVTKNTAGQDLKFHQGGAKGNKGGRPPAYVLFKTNDRSPNAEVLFTVLTYHAMYNSTAAVNATGVTSIAAAAEITQVTINANNYPVASSLIGGDFNADLLVDPAAYTALGLVGTGTVTSGLGNAAKSTLLEKTPPGGFPNTVDYRKSAYDNIYCRAVTAGPNGRVIDILDEFGIWGGAGGNLKHVAEMFDPSKVENGNLIASLPPKTRDDAWHIYSEAISNHLPVVTTVTI